MFYVPLRLVHHHPGYLRIQADSFIHPTENTLPLNRAQAAAEVTPGFRSWTHNPRTGSVVIEYDPSALDVDDFLKNIAKSAGFRGVKNSINQKMSRQGLVGTFLDSMRDVNQVVSQITGDRADLRELVPVALAATSVVSFVLSEDRGRLPNWNSALYHSYRIFMQWHRREVRTREKDARQEESGESGKSGDNR
jgi:hypothetical protein